jgi:hypothetical protein
MWSVPNTRTNHIGGLTSPVTPEPTTYYESCSNPVVSNSYRMYLDENSVCDER